MLTSGKRKKRPLFPWRSSSCSTTDTRLPYNIGGDRDWPLPMQDPISSDVRPSPENNDRCAIRNGNSVSLERVRKKIIRPTSRVLNFFFFYKTYGTTEFPDESLTVSRAIIGGVNGRRDRLAIPNSAVRRGCCTISSSYVLETILNGR